MSENRIGPFEVIDEVTMSLETQENIEALYGLSDGATWSIPKAAKIIADHGMDAFADDSLRFIMCDKLGENSSFARILDCEIGGRVLAAAILLWLGY